MKLKLKEGTTSKLVTVFIQDSSSTTGAGLTGLVFNTASLTGYWIAEGDATATALTLVTMTAGTWVSAGFVEVDATNLPGIYQVGLPDVVVDATSEGSVVVMLKGATNMAPSVMEIELDGMDYRAGVVPTVTTLTGHTSQTGDSFAIVNGASGSVATKAVVDALPSVASILSTQMTEGYSADGAAPTLEEALLFIMQFLTETTFVGTAGTTKKLDGLATAFGTTLNDASNPSSITRTS